MRLLSAPHPPVRDKRMMTISQRLDQIQLACLDQAEISARLAASLTDAELLELMLSLVLADRALGAILAEVGGRRAELRLGRSGCIAEVRLDRPGPNSLVILSDREISLVSDDEGLRRLWGAALTYRAANLLEALQFARDEVDQLLYHPPIERLSAMRSHALRWGLGEDLLLSLSIRRGALQPPASN